MDKKEMKAIVESLLFIWGDPVRVEDISKILEIKKSEAKNLLDELKDEYDYERRGLQILKFDKSYQLSTRKEHFDYVKKLYAPKTGKGISSAALETLSIIAYKQPVTKMDIEAIRGVKCDKAIQTLVEKELIKEVGRLDKMGKPIIYGTTDSFLRYFGLENLKQLPEIKELTELDIKIDMEEE